MTTPKMTGSTNRSLMTSWRDRPESILDQASVGAGAEVEYVNETTAARSVRTPRSFGSKAARVTRPASTGTTADAGRP